MPEAHKQTYRHPTYKTSYRVTNWPEYDKALRDRGDITLWVSQEAIDAWTPPHTGTCGAQPLYSDIAIETALSLRLLLNLPLRQTEGFLRSIVKLMDVALPCPDHTTVSRRHATVAIRRTINRVPKGPLDLIVDSTGLQVCGQGAWHRQQHGEKKVRRWKKLHIGADDQGQIIASTVTESHKQDPSHVPSLLAHVHEGIARFIGDGMYDQAPVYTAVTDHSPDVEIIIPPRKDAVLSLEAGTDPSQRDQHLLAIERVGRFPWKRTSGYYDQGRAENAFSRFQQTFGDRLRAKRDASQEREASLACQLLNRMRELGRPLSYPVSEKWGGKGPRLLLVYSCNNASLRTGQSAGGCAGHNRRQEEQ